MATQNLSKTIFTLALIGAAVFAVKEGVSRYKDHQVELGRREEARLAAAALLACDNAAAHPNDPKRYAAPVPDDRIALIPAAEACESAVQLNPDVARAVFQLGRVYWLANRDDEATNLFSKAQLMGYAPASKYLADAMNERRGLAKNLQFEDQQILDLYQNAKNGGFTGLDGAITAVETRIRRGVFDPSKFQYSEYMEALYSGKMFEFEYPVALAYYLQGVVSRLDSDQHGTIFVDVKCKTLINTIGNFVVENADKVAAAIELKKSQTRTAEENLKHLARGIFDNNMASLYRDYGDRDAIVLYDKEIYGCDSPVVQKIVGNVMKWSSVDELRKKFGN